MEEDSLNIGTPARFMPAQARTRTPSSVVAEGVKGVGNHDTYASNPKGTTVGVEAELHTTVGVEAELHWLRELVRERDLHIEQLSLTPIAAVQLSQSRSTALSREQGRHHSVQSSASTPSKTRTIPPLARALPLAQSQSFSEAHPLAHDSTSRRVEAHPLAQDSTRSSRRVLLAEPAAARAMSAQVTPSAGRVRRWQRWPAPEMGGGKGAFEERGYEGAFEERGYALNSGGGVNEMGNATYDTQPTTQPQQLHQQHVVVQQQAAAVAQLNHAQLNHAQLNHAQLNHALAQTRQELTLAVEGQRRAGEASQLAHEEASRATDEVQIAREEAQVVQEQARRSVERSCEETRIAQDEAQLARDEAAGLRGEMQQEMQQVLIEMQELKLMAQEARLEAQAARLALAAEHDGRDQLEALVQAEQQQRTRVEEEVRRIERQLCDTEAELQRALGVLGWSREGSREGRGGEGRGHGREVVALESEAGLVPETSRETSRETEGSVESTGHRGCATGHRGCARRRRSWLAIPHKHSLRDSRCSRCSNCRHSHRRRESVRYITNHRLVQGRTLKRAKQAWQLTNCSSRSTNISQSTRTHD
jgi:hypothetical protein